MISRTERPSAAAKTSRTSASAVSGSRCAVGSSRRSTGASDSRARAKRQALALAARELRPLLADQRLEPVWERRDPVGQPRTAEHLPELVVGRRRAREAEVRPDRRAEQMGVLAGEGERAADVPLIEIADVTTRERDAALLGIEKAKEKVRDRRLAGSARPDERDPPTRVERGGRSR